ncbi:TetR/AcrR family transcriptional regulator [Kutzneria sp. CA-103260]|uniref:TetR/AcrR family transcriptional regulator n=1 Tax=Kutzneria sp. CA-103260 TaxID=2802641 RepID=UPI001BA84D59|nr:TetR-like C-terminal domain-containing protein [Kutzneria sp. CA-103260]QUQ70846.1 TetR family transcriptional regulator [Kutzneria sp. CA-103260]
MPRPKTHDDALRGRLLACAAELISTDGVDALSLRKLAADVHTSTTAVYSLFGGKPGLIRTVYLEAFEGFERELRAAATSDDPVEDLIQLGLAYRRYALAQPHLYTLLFTDAARAHLHQYELLAEVSANAFAILYDTARRGVEAGVYVDERPEVIAVSAWGLTHGLMSLELQGNMPGGEQMGPAYERAVRALVNGWRLSRAGVENNPESRHDTRPGEVAAT